MALQLVEKFCLLLSQNEVLGDSAVHHFMAGHNTVLHCGQVMPGGLLPGEGK